MSLQPDQPELAQQPPYDQPIDSPDWDDDAPQGYANVPPQPFYDEASGQWYVPLQAPQDAAQPRNGHDEQEFEAVPLPMPIAAATQPRRRLAKHVRNRIIGAIVLLALAYALFHLLFFTDVAAPLLAYAAPVHGFVEWVKEDPTRLLVTLATFFLGNMTLYVLIFGEPR